MLHLTHNMYINRKVDLLQTNVYKSMFLQQQHNIQSIHTITDRLQTSAFTKFDFFLAFKDANVFSNSFISGVFAVSLSVDTIC